MDILPQDITAERMIIASMLMKQAALFSAVERLIPSDFYLEAHRLIFKALVRLARDGREPNLVELRQVLLDHGCHDRIGGDLFLVDLYRELGAHDIEGLIRVITGTAKKRKALELANDMKDRLASHIDDVDAFLTEYDQKLLEIRIDRSNGLRSMRELCNVRPAGLCTSGSIIRSQFKDLNYLIKGWKAGCYYILAARTSKGKSALGLQFAVHVAKEKPVLFFSLEMRPADLRNRILASLADVETRQMEEGKLDQEQERRIAWALEAAAQLRLEFSQKRFIHEITAIARRRNQEEKLGLVVVDYIQRIKMHGAKSMQRYQVIGEISGELQGLAQEIDVPVLGLSQVTRTVSSEDREPELSDLRESGDLEQDADLVMFIHTRTNEFVSQSHQMQDILIKKNRGGPLGTVELTFIKPYQRYE